MSSPVPHPRRPARILALQALCQLDVQGDSFYPEVDGFLAENSESAQVVGYARRLIEQAWRHRQHWDERIAAAAKHWSVDRLLNVDRSLLRLAIGEMSAGGDPPAKVVMNEAIELAKQFGDKQSPQFINGILDAILQQPASAHATGNEPAPSTADTHTGESCP